MLTIAAPNALSSVAHNATLTGNGTSGMPLSVANGGIGTGQLADNAVTAAKIASGQVVKSLNGLFDTVTLVGAGPNITITPSGNMLTIAAPNALSSVAHNATLTGNGTSGMPLSVAAPLSLSQSFPIAILTVTNSGSGGGVFGSSTSGDGVHGSSSSNNKAGVFGQNTGSGPGVFGQNTGSGPGVSGSSGSGIGVSGSSGSGPGISGFSSSGTGVKAVTLGSGSIIDGFLVDILRFRVTNGGDVQAHGTFMNNSLDFAEMMEVEEASGPEANSYQPGDVLIISPQTGKLKKCSQPYCSLVAGIYSTNPGFLGGQGIEEKSTSNKVPLALIGQVPCKVTTENGPIRIGDLLVTSSTPGYAMKGTDRSQMLGAIVGKALEPLSSGTGTIKVLVTLQ
jgi:hypothetical protein